MTMGAVFIFPRFLPNFTTRFPGHVQVVQKQYWKMQITILLPPCTSWVGYGNLYLSCHKAYCGTFFSIAARILPPVLMFVAGAASGRDPVQCRPPRRSGQIRCAVLNFSLIFPPCSSWFFPADERGKAQKKYTGWLRAVRRVLRRKM